MRWRNVTIPQGATITSAYIEFDVDEADSGTTNLTFRGEDADNAAVFANIADNISDRTKTSASVSWNNVPAWGWGETHQSEDISPVIQEIVNRGGWASGNALVVIVTGSGERIAESHDGDGTPPLLHVEYSTATDVHLDSTSNDNDGIPNGNTLTASGKIDGAQDFDGVNDYVDAGNSASLDVNYITIEFWLKVNSWVSDGGILSKGTSSARRYWIWTYGGTVAFEIDEGGNYNDAWNPPSGQWQHLALTYDGSNVITYRNGDQEINTYPQATGTIDATTEPLLFGDIPPYNHADMDLDEVRISNTARSAEWIQTSFNNQNDPSSFYSWEKNCPSTVPPIAEFTCSIPLTIDSSKVSGSEDLDNFPVLISLTNTSLKTTGSCGYVQNSNGYDIIFSDATQTTRLDHEIEKYDGASGELVAWVSVPTLKWDEDTVINIHYGHSSVCGATENPTGVWDSNFTTVWHLKETSGGSGAIKDSTARDNHGTDFNSPTFGVTGKIGNAIDFDGTNDYATMPTSGFNTSAGTVELWTNIDTFPSADNKYMFSHLTSPTANRVYVNLKPDNTWGTGMGDTYDLVRGSVVSAGTWYHLVLTWDGTNVRGYKDGTLNFGPTSYSGLTTVGNIYVSAWDNTAEWFDGTLDEVRVSETVRSADWIQTSYNNQSNPTSFYSVGTSSCFLGGFSCNRRVTIDSTKVAGSSDLTNFPFLIKVQNDCNLKTAANGGGVQNSSGWDIIFTDSDGVTQLDHEIEEYDGTTGDLTAWVRVPTLPYNSDKDIYIYYGKSGLTCDPSNPAGVWQSGYAGVWHLNETTGSTHYDSTSNDNDGTQNGNSSAGGKISGAQDFDGSQDWIEVPNSSSLDITGDEITLSAWVQMTADQSDDAGIINKSYSNNYNYMLNVQSSEVGDFRVKTPSGTTYLDGSTTLSVGQWYFLYGIYNGSTARVYLDGSQDGTDSRTGNIESSGAAPVAFGRRRVYPTVDDRFFDGIIDEARISNVARSVDWMKTEYNNQDDPDSFSTMSQDTCGGQYGLFYKYCKKIVVDHTQVDSDLTNFPLLINLDNDDDLKGRVKHSQGWDIVFRTSGCGNLDHEIEKYEGSEGDLVAWVKIPTLSSGTDTEIYMYYGGPSNVLCSPENPAGVWDSSTYAAVYHLNDDFKDSTSNDRDGTNYGATFTPSQIGNGALFTPSNGWDRIELGTWSVSGDDMTLQAWVWPNDFNQDDPRIVTKCSTSGASTQDHVWQFGLQDGDNGENRMRLRVKTGWDNTLGTVQLNGSSPNGYLSTAQDWYFLAAIYDDDNSSGSEMRMYRDDGLDAGQLAHAGNLRTNSWPVWIGASPTDSSNTNKTWDGIIDEVRIVNIEQSQNWLEAEYRNQNNPGNFYTVTSCFEQTTEVTQEWVEEVQ
jgi:hypothetical protein